MARVQDVKQFNEVAYRSTVKAMKAKGENVHDAGKQYRDKTGTLHPNVNIIGKPRGSHNAMIPEEDGSYHLPHGISLPVLSVFDGTASTSQWLEDFFRTAERQFKLLDGVRTRYNPQLATGVINDVYNVHEHGIPVVQNSQFESDERSTDQVRLLMPASMGNNTFDEDYDLGLFYYLSITADFWEFYGLKGYLTIALDEIGRGFVTGDGVKEYLGQSADLSDITTEEICEQLLEHWNLFILQVPTYNGMLLDSTYDWWSERVGKSRVIRVKNPNLLADIRAALIYVTEANNPTQEGFTRFLQTGDKLEIDASDLDVVWRVIQSAQEHFSAQSKLPGYNDIPLPGNKFVHYRHAWPIGHSRQGENVIPEPEPV